MDGEGIGNEGVEGEKRRKCGEKRGEEKRKERERKGKEKRKGG